MSADPQSVLSHGLVNEPSGYPLLDPSQVKKGVDRGDGVLGTLESKTAPPPSKGNPVIARQIDKAYNNTLAKGYGIAEQATITPPGGAYDPATGTVASPSGGPYTFNMIPRQYKGSNRAYRAAEGDADLLRRGAVEFGIRAADVPWVSKAEDLIGSVITWAGQSYRVDVAEPEIRMEGFTYTYKAGGNLA